MGLWVVGEGEGGSAYTGGEGGSIAVEEEGKKVGYVSDLG